MKPVLSKSVLSSVACLVLCLSAGCNRKVDLRDVHSSNIKKMHVCYMMYLGQNEMRGPKDEGAFKQFLTTDPTAAHLLKKIDLTPATIEDIFTSERDGEPFVVRYGVKGPADHALIFEATGVDGKRLVSLSNPIELEASEYEAYLNGKKKGEQIGAATDFGD